jgi:electron transport complex protein RnfB
VGANKLMHTVLPNDCTGCDLCIAPCPVDCISMVAVEPAKTWTNQDAILARTRFEKRQIRLSSQGPTSLRHAEQAPPSQDAAPPDRQAAIAQALLRARARRTQP